MEKLVEQKSFRLANGISSKNIRISYTTFVWFVCNLLVGYVDLSDNTTFIAMRHRRKNINFFSYWYPDSLRASIRANLKVHGLFFIGERSRHLDGLRSTEISFSI